MSVYLGDEGCIQIRRQGDPFQCVLQADDVNVTQRRFSIDWDGDGTIENRPSPLITGDRVEFSTLPSSDGTSPNLVLVSGHTDSDITRWVHVDQKGGIRLYTTYQDAVNGGKDNAIELEPPADDQNIKVTVDDLPQYNCVAQMRSWEITTQRETVDTSILGEEYREFYDQGLISGQGAITAIWDYKFTPCADRFSDTSELANYFSSLVIRFREGARFKGLFIIYADADNEAVWYEADCICTSVGMSFTPGSVIQSNIQFVTTGQIWLRQGEPPSYLLTDGDGFRAGSQLLLEEGEGSVELEFSE